MSTLIGPAQGASSSSIDTVRVELTPSAGFCIKSITTEAGFYTYVNPPNPLPQGTNSSSKSKLLEPTPKTRTLQIPRGMKVFLNIAWDKRVPSPPAANEDAVRRAMAGEDLVDEGLGAYYVPVVVSEPREDLDKNGKPSIVFDCVFSASLKSRCAKDREYKLYLIELALEHVEEKTHITLSRQIGTPNIASKGKLEPRTVLMPRALVDPGSASKIPAASRSEPLVQEIRGSVPLVSRDEGNGTEREGRANDIRDETNASSNTKPRSILKASPAASTSAETPASAFASAGVRKPLIEEVTNGVQNTALGPDNSLDERAASALPPLQWKWAKDGGRLRIEIDVPGLTHELHAQSTLDIEPRRVLLHIPQKHFLDINLDLSDAQIGKLGAVTASELDAKDASIAQAMDVDVLRVRGRNAGETLRLKRERDFDVENARAEWRVNERKLVISV